MKIAITCMFRDEARYLKEWIEFHLLVGVDKFYLSNNLSEDNYLEVLEPYISRGIVTLNQVTDNRALTEGGMIMHVQNEAFTWAVLKAREDGIDWLGLLNADEFWYPVKEANLQAILATFGPEVGQVCVNWQMFGHSFKSLEPGELLIEHLTLTQGTDLENRHVKTIVRPGAVMRCVNAHYVDLYEGYISMNSHHQVRSIEYPWPAWPDPDSGEEYHVGPFDLPVRKDIMILNHYTMRDLNFCEQKCQWYRGFGYDEPFIQWCKDRANDVENTVIHRFLPGLKERMNVI